jgi:hypothetical protein
MATVEPIQPFDMPTRPVSCCNRDYALSKYGLLRFTLIVSVSEIFKHNSN